MHITESRLRQIIRETLAEGAGDTIPSAGFNAAHEAALKMLGLKLKGMGFKYTRDSQSALFDWSWEKDGFRVSISGWGPKKGWGDSYCFFEVTTSEGFEPVQVVWQNTISAKDFSFVREQAMIPARLKDELQRSIDGASRAVLAAVQGR